MSAQHDHLRRLSQDRPGAGLSKSTTYSRISEGAFPTHIPSLSLLDVCVGYDIQRRIRLEFVAMKRSSCILQTTQQPASPSTNPLGESVPVPAWQLILPR